MGWSITTWWIIAAVVLGLSELLVGTFYLLLLGVGALCGALVSLAGFSLDIQCFVAAVVILVGGIALARYHAKAKRKSQNAEVDNLDIGQTVTVKKWSEDHTATVSYRGAAWQAVAKDGAKLEPGVFVIVEVRGSKLVVAPKENAKS